MKIYLIGYMGSGKSTLGRNIAIELGFTAIDMDDEFEAKYKIGIQDFFDKYGEVAFRELERKLLIDISIKDNIIVSTGGGTPCFFDNLNLMKQGGLIIYLKSTPELIISRIKSVSRKRPLLQQMMGENMIEKIKNHMQKREPFYSQAHLQVNATSPDVEEITNQILKYYCSANEL